MNEHQLRRLLRRLVLLSAPLPLAVLGPACGGSSMVDSDGSAGTTAQGGQNHGGAGQAGAASAGAGGSVSVAGAGGSVSVAGAGGSVSVAGAGGSVSVAGAGGGVGVAGASGGGGTDCNGHLEFSCAPANATVPRNCVSAEQAVVSAQLPIDVCAKICPPAGSSNGCTVNSLTTTTVNVRCLPGCAIGRRPAGLGEPGTCDTRAVGNYFAEAAHLEAASVTAFRVLRDELRAKGAPKKLVRAAARAARDEVRHTRATGALARRYGGTPRMPRIEPAQPRSLEAIALENAVEGCVRETYGALLATRQAELATDPLVRAAMMRIARDETRHASLSWSVARWLEIRLDAGAKQNVERAKQAAAEELLSTLANEGDLSFAGLAGLPSPAEATRMATAMRRALWS